LDEEALRGILSVADSNESVNGWGDVIGNLIVGIWYVREVGWTRCGGPLFEGWVYRWCRKDRKTAGFIGLVVRIAG